MMKHILIIVGLLSLVCEPAQATTLGEFLNAQAASRSNADIGQRVTKYRRHHRNYRRVPVRKSVPDEAVAETVTSRQQYRCLAVASFAEPVDPYRYGEINVSAWLTAIAPPIWTTVRVVDPDEYNEVDAAGG